MGLASGEPMVSTGIMTSTWQLGGRFLRQEYLADPLEGFSDRFAGEGYWGYNTATGQYEGFWIDNASTTMQLEKGQVDDRGKVWEMHSQSVHPGSGQTLNKRSVITLVDDDNHRMESFVTGPDGQEMRVMEIIYTRMHADSE
jgi:hypothetical protein